ncbi:pseudaminic acid cytidylyltransferase [Photobacterium frigidiphilum]|uniref:Pseudaminic acid cytidylyltransferase n=1 Tax=Photobacterium frigidiphilum TaxID=264736 RepID=A0A2T3JPG0_9GAMM|nr:pseudaminic acid cytidylyltransferase [Photobacterium frigidiphilum]PSU50928.1 pseudaminic acid cytidylyltransferase [Photobacterium frigidiphilum]
MTKILAIIPARGGSKRIPQKNIKYFLGQPIISYPINALLSSTRIDTLFVSTDCKNIRSVAEKFGATVPFMRSDKNSDDFATTYEVIEEVLTRCDEEYDFVCCVYPTSAFVTTEMIDCAVDILKSDDTATSIAGVLEYSHPIQRALRVEGKYVVSTQPDCYNMRSQDLEKIYHDAGQFYIFSPKAVRQEKKLITKDCIPFIINPNLAHDIDTQEDWDLAELKYQFMSLKV